MSPMPGTAVLLLALLTPGTAPVAQTPGPGRLPLTGYFEPSGVAQLPDGRLILVEDENRAPVSVLEFDDRSGFSGEPVKPDALAFMSGDRTRVGRLNDLEAVTVAADGYVYAIASHSRRVNGKRLARREKLVRFRGRGNRAVDVSMLPGLRDRMAALHADIAAAARITDAGDDDHLSVEGMACDPVRKRLLIGMRGPTIDGMSVVASLPDPDAVFLTARGPRGLKMIRSCWILIAAASGQWRLTRC